MTAPAVRFDFGSQDAAPTSEDQARAQAIAAQKAWRLSEIVGALAAPPSSEKAGVLAVRADAVAPGGLLEAVKIVRGQLPATPTVAAVG